VSWWQCAQAALRCAVEQGALAAVPPVEQQRLDEVPFFRETRPRHTAMDNSRLTSKLGIQMPSAGETIAAAVRRFLASGG
jgi:hypothetical protein